MMITSAVETAFTVTFGRAGEDNKRFKLGDVDTTLQGFAGADYDLQAPPLLLKPAFLALLLLQDIMTDYLQDCLTGATFKRSGKRDKDGQEFYDYEISSSVS